VQPRPAAHVSRGGLAAALVGVALVGGLVGVGADRLVTGQVRLPMPVQTTAAQAPSAPPVAAPAGQAAPSGQPGQAAQSGQPGQRAQSGPAGQAAQPGQAAPAAPDATQQAIRDVIKQGDDAQAQAFASNDPSPMAAGATNDFYQQQVAVNQDLQANGVTAIKLVTIEWGPITVNGSTATATAFETWSTTYSDGSTEQSRDRNVYTLVLDNGAWKISDDQHPDDPFSGRSGGGSPFGVIPGGPSTTGPGQGQGNGGFPGGLGGFPGQGSGPGGLPGRGRGTAPAPTQPGQPAVPVPAPAQPALPRNQRGENTSQNWAGYAATGGKFTAVNGTWTVPQFTPSSPAGADAAWVGIGGVNTRDLIQAGTQQTVTGNGTTQYQAWVETLPQASHPVNLTINPGDSVSVSITQQQAPTEWLIAFKNNTTGQTLNVTEHYTSSMTSAEWIQEAPSAARGQQIPLDNFGTISFSAGGAVKDGKSVNIADAGAQAITMINRAGQTQASTSTLGADGASFSVSRA
jgi:hypothetical protein